MGKWTRRGFITAGVVGGTALVVGIAIRPGHRAPGLAKYVAGEGESLVNAWVKIDGDNKVTAIVPHSEMGQGAQTALTQMLADELDAAEDAGEKAKRGRPRNVVDDDVFSAADLGLRRDQIADARKTRDAEAVDPGITERALNNIVARGEEPTKAKLRREIEPKTKPKMMDPRALWLWGRLKDFVRNDVLSAEPVDLLAEMTEPMRDDVARLAPLVRAWIEELETLT